MAGDSDSQQDQNENSSAVSQDSPSSPSGTERPVALLIRQLEALRAEYYDELVKARELVKKRFLDKDR